MLALIIFSLFSGLNGMIFFTFSKEDPWRGSVETVYSETLFLQYCKSECLNKIEIKKP